MAIRDKLRRTFGKKSNSSSSGGSTPSTGSDQTHYTGRTDIEYYKPNEIPKSKYKGRVDPEHKERLEAYTFADAFNTIRRKSSQALSGIMSPGGTKSQSRRPSYMSHMSKASKDTRRKSIAATTTGPNEDAHPLSRQVTQSAAPAPLIRENSDDDTNVNNAGISQAVDKIDNPRTATNAPDVNLERHATAPDQPFTLEELQQAMTRATLRPNHDGAMRNSIAIAAH